MKLIGSHCLCSPKSGITTAESVWKSVKVNDKLDYMFLQGRNPYHRFVSIFAHKFMDINGGKASKAKISKSNFKDREANDLKKEVKRVFGLKSKYSIMGVTFHSFFYDIISKEKRSTEWSDAHVGAQSIHVNKFLGKIQDTILVENLPNAYGIPAKRLGIDLNLEDVPWKVKTNRCEDIEWTGKVYDLTVEEWWTLGCIPNDYTLFYNEQLLNDVYEYYKEDFLLLNVSKGQL